MLLFTMGLEIMGWKRWCSFFTGGAAFVGGSTLLAGGMVGNEVRKYISGLVTEVRASNITENNLHLDVAMGAANFTPMRVSMNLPINNLVRNNTDEWLESMVTGVGWTASLTSGTIVFLLLSFGTLLAGGWLYHNYQITKMQEQIDSLIETGSIGANSRRSDSSYGDDASEEGILTESPAVPYRQLDGLPNEEKRYNRR
jgi:hypothetical protein